MLLLLWDRPVDLRGVDVAAALQALHLAYEGYELVVLDHITMVVTLTLLHQLPVLCRRMPVVFLRIIVMKALLFRLILILLV